MSETKSGQMTEEEMGANYEAHIKSLVEISRENERRRLEEESNAPKRRGKRAELARWLQRIAYAVLAITIVGFFVLARVLGG